MTIKKNVAGQSIYTMLWPMTGTGKFVAGPTLATGDVTISLDGGAFANLATLPVVTPAGSGQIKIALSQAETNADNIVIYFGDLAGAQWADQFIHEQTEAAAPDVNILTAAGTAWNSGAISANTLAADALTAAKVAADVGTEIAAAVWAATTRLLTAGTNIVLAKGTGVTGFNDLDAPGIRAAIGMAAANLDTQLTTIDDFLDTEITDIRNRLPAALVGGRMDASVGAMATDVLTSTALAASAVTEIQTGLATSASVTTLQADTDDIQTRLPAALVGGRMDASVGAMANNTITSNVIATDAITSNQMAASAVTEIQTGLATSASISTLPSTIINGVWDATTVGHITAGTFGAQLKTQVDTIVAYGAPPSASFIAGQVWDMSTTGHSVGGTFGEQVKADIDAIVTRTSGLTYTVANRVDTQVIGLQNDTIDSLALAASAASKITNQVWNEVLAGHLTAGSTGRKLSDIPLDSVTDTAVAVWSAPVRQINALDPNALSDFFDIDTTYTAASAVSGSVVKEIISGASAGGSAPSAATVAAAVWDLNTAGHTTVGTFGAQGKTNIDAIKAKTDQMTFTIANRLNVQVYGMQTDSITGLALATSAGTELAAAIWNEPLVTYVTAGTAGKKLADIPITAPAVPTTAEIADAVWDEDVSTHFGGLKAGQYLDDILTAADTVYPSEANTIADALLDRVDAVETGVTVRGALRLNTAALAGKVSGAGSGTETFRNAVQDSKNRITSTVDANGNRTVVATDVT